MNSDRPGRGWQQVECDLCGSSRATAFLAVASAQTADAPYVLEKCSDCGLVFLNPRPSPAIIGQYYSKDYYAHGGINSRRLTLKARLRNWFLEALGGYDNGTSSAQLIRRLVSPGIIDIIIPSKRKGKLLDVGCGDGERVQWYGQRGFEAYGVEISERAVRSARDAGIAVRQGTLPEAGYPESFFDVVLMAHVLEHTHSPATYLKESLRILKPGGILAVAVPNIESHSAGVFKECWGLLMLPIHLYHFSVCTLSAYLSKSGFKIDRMLGKTVYPRMVRKSGKTVRNNLGLLPFAEAWARSGIVASTFYQLVCGPKKCDAITAYCSKPRADR